MKKRISKIIGVVVFSLIILVLGIFTYLYFNHAIRIYKGKEFKNQGSPVIESQLSKDEVKEDIDYIIDIMESTHPIFLEEVPESYYTAKDELLAASNEEMTVGELQCKVSRYLSSINDGHTALWWTENMFLDIDWKYLDGNLYLLDSNKKLTDKVVTKISDIEIEKIVESIKIDFPAENYVAEAKNIESFLKGKLVLENVGVDCTKDILVTLSNEEEDKILEVEFISGPEYRSVNNGIYSKVIDKNIAYIRLGTCDVNSTLKSVIENIEKYKNEGIKDYIIDVIDNPGGVSNACSMLLEALNMKGGTYGGMLRFSSLAQEQLGYLRKSGHIEYRSNNNVVKNNDINLYILTNENTFSSAQMLAVWVSDGNLGKIVGRPSSNMPSNYGDVLKFQMKNSKLIGQISHKKFIRPDIRKDKEQVLQPDIYVEYGDDILERAIDYINE